MVFNSAFKVLTCFRVTNTRCRIDTVISPDVGHTVDWNMYRMEINIQEKLCTRLVLFTRDCFLCFFIGGQAVVYVRRDGNCVLRRSKLHLRRNF